MRVPSLAHEHTSDRVGVDRQTLVGVDDDAEKTRIGLKPIICYFVIICIGVCSEFLVFEFQLSNVLPGGRAYVCQKRRAVG